MSHVLYNIVVVSTDVSNGMSSSVIFKNTKIYLFLLTNDRESIRRGIQAKRAETESDILRDWVKTLTSFLLFSSLDLNDEERTRLFTEYEGDREITLSVSSETVN